MQSLLSGREISPKQKPPKQSGKLACRKFLKFAINSRFAARNCGGNSIGIDFDPIKPSSRNERVQHRKRRACSGNVTHQYAPRTARLKTIAFFNRIGAVSPGSNWS